jgi:hypothetical protein
MRVPVHGLTTGITSQGPDLGSDQVDLIEPPQIAVIIGEGIGVPSAGSLWFMLDSKLRIPVTRIDSSRLATANLKAFTCIVVPDGSLGSWPDATIQQLARWCENGGHLIACGRNAPTLERRLDALDNPGSKGRGVELMKSVKGVTFQIELPAESPLTWGYESNRIPVFQDHGWVFASSATFQYTDRTVLSGYVAPEELEKLVHRGALIQQTRGTGRLTAMTFDPVFRGHYYISLRLLLNAIYFR